MRFCTLLLLLAASIAARATTVQPPTFAELVAEADGIYRGRVTSVEARRTAAPDAARVIKTFVTFRVDRVIKGAAREEIVLEFLGGTVGDETLDVGGMPHFSVGQREILFVQKNGVQFCPLVRLGHGRYRVERDAGTQLDFIARDNRAPLTSVNDVTLPLEPIPALGPMRAAAARHTPLSSEAFEARIRGELKTQSNATLP